MSITNFNTSNQTFRKLMGNGLIYRVPMFQRDYSCTEQEWDDLWQDMVAMLEPDGEKGHYMGYLVLQSSLTRHSDLFKTIRASISSKADVFLLLRNMDSDADIVAALNATDIIRALRPVYPTDKQFHDAFSEKQIRTISRNRKVMRHVLFGIEGHVSNRVFDYTSDKYTIEHIYRESK